MYKNTISVTLVAFLLVAMLLASITADCLASENINYSEAQRVLFWSSIYNCFESDCVVREKAESACNTHERAVIKFRLTECINKLF